MEISQFKKFKLQPDTKVLVLNAPAEYKFPFESKIITINKAEKDVIAIHLFVRNQKELESNFKKVVPILNDETNLWLFYPKSSSKIKTDINRDSIVKFIDKFPVKISSLVSYNDTWSAFLIRKKEGYNQDNHKKTDLSQYLPYIDFQKREITLPEDFKKELIKNKKAFQNFEKLSFTHKKEYIMAILDAKKEETRKRRIQKTIEMLSG